VWSAGGGNGEKENLEEGGRRMAEAGGVKRRRNGEMVENQRIERIAQAKWESTHVMVCRLLFCCAGIVLLLSIPLR
jgi:hypothetical protein